MSILDIQKRYRELGRIRLGTKDDRGNPKKLDTFRLTSTDRNLLEQASELFGGDVAQWGDGQWELVTTTDRLPIYVPPQDIDHNQHYEMWSGGGLQRRCDGFTQQDGSSCACNPDSRECKPVTHLIVMLRVDEGPWPDIGTWRLTSRGYNAAAELGQTVQFLMDRFVASGELLAGTLRMEQRSKRTGGVTHRWVTPVIDTTAAEIAALGQRTERPALTTPEPAAEPETPQEPSDGSGQWDTLLHLLEEDPKEGTRDDIEARTRQLFHLMGAVGLWPGDAFHAALDKNYGAKHWSDLRVRANMEAFAVKAFEAAKAKVEGSE